MSAPNPGGTTGGKDTTMPETKASPLLSVEGLNVAYGSRKVVHDVGFTLARGGSLALIGESGSGKSTIAKAVLRLLQPAEATVDGSVRLAGTEVLSLAERQFRPLRGRQLGFIPQDPGSALNPVRSIGAQAHEAAALIGERDAGARRRIILEVFDQVGLPDPVRVYDSYPHQLSGGMLQRVLIALTVLPRPSLIVADEPTSALDVTVQKLILDLLGDLRKELDIGLLLITHDLAIAAERADTLVVLKDGAVQEQGPSAQVFAAPRTDYARNLQADVPALNPDRYRSQRTGAPQDTLQGTASQDVATQDGTTPDATTADRPAQIAVTEVTKSFRTRGKEVRAVDGVSFAVERGRTHALVGESGSGKTTAVRLLLGLEQPDSGSITVGGHSTAGLSRAGLRDVRRHLQLVYQNPFTSLDPTWKVGRIVREPLDRFGVGSTADRADRVRDALQSVGLPGDAADRRPSQLSGGQRQRVAIARALVVRPDVVVLDEPTSALDVSVQAGILELLARLQRDLGLTYVFVSHDLALVRQVADTVSVLRRGRVVEHGTVDQVFDRPQHPYTRALLDAIPGTSGLALPAVAEAPAEHSNIPKLAEAAL
ncbi:ABC transporter related [Pseudarthrobacter chlorophenolicus A6]|uniref:ABC transporter related n=1 Tax=Pseudarthrobacter chlorophenolicus (strain ATCC 700700 / DSM 12829 / CIP 107037 / JCM 12360 / KCTC 9906 / NCIMB 13794 / A6) TaxID=452863 RepID=B8H7H5_PSECP|nr:ABC transporter ATP-binding protein [Pseudarthrobacter chlorophenolicus]ACL39755.1 ABC transporter related [Pseudarthrobacter chlorophenolicus A6]SDQ94271.1 peptide/nickel transport system ATP-binding protein [Pseudarthrobacter chlorophenolicus]